MSAPATPPDPFIVKARELFADSGMTLEQLGLEMGFEKDVARKSAWQLLHKIGDPRLSSARRLAKALGVPLSRLLKEEK